MKTIYTLSMALILTSGSLFAQEPYPHIYCDGSSDYYTNNPYVKDQSKQNETDHTDVTLNNQTYKEGTLSFELNEQVVQIDFGQKYTTVNSEMVFVKRQKDEASTTVSIDSVQYDVSAKIIDYNTGTYNDYNMGECAAGVHHYTYINKQAILKIKFQTDPENANTSKTITRTLNFD